MIKKRILTVGMVMMIMLFAGCANPQPYASPTPSVTPLPGLVVTPVPPIATPVPMVTAGPELTTSVPGTVTTVPGVVTEAPPVSGATGQSDLESAKSIQADVDKMSEISKSSVLVMEDTALVGVQFDSQYKGDLTDRIKEMIVKKAEGVNPAITKVAVTADAEKFKRVEDLAARVNSGTPFSQIALEISELVNGLLPRG